MVPEEKSLRGTLSVLENLELGLPTSVGPTLKPKRPLRLGPFPLSDPQGEIRPALQEP